MSANFPAQVAPMGHVARVALLEQEAGLIRQQAMQQVITQQLTRDNEQVQGTSAGEQGQRVRRRRHGRERGRENNGQQDGQADGQPQSASGQDEKLVPPDLFETLSLSDSPEPPGQDGNVWAGNIVNVNV